MSIYDNETKIYPDLNPTAPQEPQTCRLKKLTEIEAFFLDEIEARRREAKKKKRLNTSMGIVDRRHRLNYLSSDHWRRLYPNICWWFWPTHWRCLGWAWGSPFAFNGHHTKIFQESNGETRKTRCRYASCPKYVRQHSRYNFTGNARRRHLPL